MYLSDNKSRSTSFIHWVGIVSRPRPPAPPLQTPSTVDRSRGPIFGLFLKLSKLLPLSILLHFFKIKVYAQQVLCELWRYHPCRGLFVRIEAIDLCLEVVAVWVTIVETDGRAVIDAPIWFNAESLSLAIGQEQLRDIVKVNATC